MTTPPPNGQVTGSLVTRSFTFLGGASGPEAGALVDHPAVRFADLCDPGNRQSSRSGPRNTEYGGTGGMGRVEGEMNRLLPGLTADHRAYLSGSALKSALLRRLESRLFSLDDRIIPLGTESKPDKARLRESPLAPLFGAESLRGRLAFGYSYTTRLENGDIIRTPIVRLGEEGTIDPGQLAFRYVLRPGIEFGSIRIRYWDLTDSQLDWVLWALAQFNDDSDPVTIGACSTSEFGRFRWTQGTPSIPAPSRIQPAESAKAPSLQNLSTKAVGHLSPIIKVLRIEMKTCQPLFVGDCSPLFYLSQPSTGGARYRGLHDRPLSDPCRTGPASRVLVDPRGTRGNETEVRTSAKLWDPDLAAWRFYIPSRTIKGIFRRDIERELAAVYESHDIADEHAERVVSSLFGDQNRRGFVDFTEGVVKAAGAEREGKVSYSNDTVPTDLLVPGHRGRLITSNSLCRWKQASLSSRRTGGLRTYLAVAEGAGFTFEVRLRCNAPWLESMIRNTLGRLTSGTLRFGARGKDGCGLVSLVSLDAVYRGGIATAAGVDADELEQVLRALVSSA